MLHFGYNGLWGLLVLIGDVWAIINIIQSSASNEKKLLWTLVVLLLPVLALAASDNVADCSGPKPPSGKNGT